jgi:hypothetical protein
MIIFRSMFMTAATNLADYLHRLLEAVKEACGMNGRWPGLLAGPIALLVWIRTRRMRKEIEAAAKHFATMMEQLLVLLEEYRAGKLTAQNAPDVCEELEAAEANPRPTPARPQQTASMRRPVAETLPPRFSAAEVPDPEAASPSPLRLGAGLPPDLIRGEGAREAGGEVSFCFLASRRIRSATQDPIFFKRHLGERGTCGHFVPDS